MSLHWYACISTNTCCFEMYHILLETDWWALPNASLIVQIRLAVHEILADKAFTATDVLISQLFVVAFVPPIYIQIVFIWGFPAQLILWKSVHWLWRYKLNEVCDILRILGDLPLTSLLLTGLVPVDWSIFVLLETFTEGSKVCLLLDWIVVLKEVGKMNLFAVSLIGATIQDGGKRKRSDVFFPIVLPPILIPL